MSRVVSCALLLSCCVACSLPASGVGHQGRQQRLPCHQQSWPGHCAERWRQEQGCIRLLPPLGPRGQSPQASAGAHQLTLSTSASVFLLIYHYYHMLLLPKSRCVCRQAACEGCHMSYPMLDLPDPSKTQSTIIKHCLCNDVKIPIHVAVEV